MLIQKNQIQIQIPNQVDQKHRKNNSQNIRRDSFLKKDSFIKSIKSLVEKIDLFHSDQTKLLEQIKISIDNQEKLLLSEMKNSIEVSNKNQSTLLHLLVKKLFPEQE